MNEFFKRSNHVTNKLMVIAVIVLSVSMFLSFTAIRESKIQSFHLKWTYYDNEMKAQAMKESEQLEFDSEESRIEYAQRVENEATLLLNKFLSLKSKKQTFFLEAENTNQRLNQELVDEYPKLDDKDYNSGKVRVNNYLINNQLPLKSLNYSTDSAIFTMNVLEFLNTPLFFLCFFLLMPISYFKKYEDGRIKFLLTQPLPRKKIIWQDYQLFITNSVVLFGLITVVSASFSFIISREISLLYPIQLTLLGTTQIIPIYQYLIVLVISFPFIGTFIFSVTYLLVLLSKKVMIALFLMTIICLSWNTFIVNNSILLDGLNPFAYVNVEKASKNITANDEVRYVVQTDRHIGIDDLVMGNVVENPYYYANQSLARQVPTVDLVMLPTVLTLYSLCLFFINSNLLKRYQI